FSTSSLSSKTVPYSRETSSRSSFWLARVKARPSAVVGCGRFIPFGNCGAGAFGMAAARDRTPLFPVSQEAERDQDVGNAGESERHPTTRYVHKSPNWRRAKRRPLTDLRFGPSEEAEGAKRNSRVYVFKERRQLQLRLRGKFASMFAASF